PGCGLAGTRQAQVADCGQHGAGSAADQVALEAADRAGCFQVGEPAEEALDVAASQRGRLAAPVGAGAQAVRQPSRRADDVADVARPGAAVPGQVVRCPPLGGFPDPPLGDAGEVELAAMTEDCQVPGIPVLLATGVRYCQAGMTCQRAQQRPGGSASGHAADVTFPDRGDPLAGE